MDRVTTTCDRMSCLGVKTIAWHPFLVNGKSNPTVEYAGSRVEYEKSSVTYTSAVPH